MSTWIKVHNAMPSHPKLLAAGDRAAWLFVCGCCYSNEHLTDGFIATHVLAVAAPGVRQAELLASRLVGVGLWHEVDGGWRIHDYEEHQRSGAEVRERRANDAERQAKRRSKSRRDSANGHSVTPQGQITESEQNPSGVTTAREKRREEKSTSASPQLARRRVKRQVDQSKPPDQFPANLTAVLEAALPILHGIWEVRGGVEPQPRGVGLSLLRNPAADHLSVVRKLEHWMLAGRGQHGRCGDVAARFGDWVENEGAASNVVALGSSSLHLPESHRVSSEWTAQLEAHIKQQKGST